MENENKEPIFYYPGPDWSVPTLYYWKLSDLVWLIPCASLSLYLALAKGTVTPLALTLCALFLRIGNGRVTIASMLWSRISFLLRRPKAEKTKAKTNDASSGKTRTRKAEQKRKRPDGKACERTDIEKSFWFERRTGR